MASQRYGLKGRGYIGIMEDKMETTTMGLS